MVIQENAVADDGVWPQRTQRLQPFDGRLAVATHDFLELDDALGGMDLEGEPALARRLRGIGDELRRAGIDLSRADHAGEPARRVLLCAVDEAECAFHRFPAGLLVPFIAHSMAVARSPAPSAEHGRGLVAHPALDHTV